MEEWGLSDHNNPGNTKIFSIRALSYAHFMVVGKDTV